MDKLMNIIADWIASKNCFLTFCVIAFLPLLIQSPQGILQMQNYLSQTVIQLIALNVLALASKQDSEKTNELLQRNHDIIMEELNAIKSLKENK